MAEAFSPPSFDDFRRDVPVESRVLAYWGLAIALLAAPEEISDEELMFLSQGLFRDSEAEDWIKAHHAEVDIEDPMLLTYAGIQSLFDEKHGRDPAITEMLGSGDRVKREGLQIPLTVAALVGAGYAGGLAPAITAKAAEGGLLGFGARALLGAANIIGKPPSILFNRWTFGAGVGSLIPATLVQTLANDRMMQAQLDALAERDRRTFEAVTGQQHPANFVAQNIRDVSRALLTGQPIRRPQSGYQATAGGARDAARSVAQRALGASGLTASDYISRTGGVPDPAEEQQAYEDNPWVGDGIYFSRGYQPPPLTGSRGIEYNPELSRPENQTGLPGRGISELRYRESDISVILGNMTPSQFYDFQVMAERAGLINPDSFAGQAYVRGAHNIHTLRALENLLAISNFEGDNWRSTLHHLAELGDDWRAQQEQEGRETAFANRAPFMRRAYIEPDYEALSQDIEDTVSARLGRKVNAWEMAILADQIRSLHRQQFDQAEAERLATWEAQGRALLSGEKIIDAPEPGEAIDLDARFRSSFEDLFSEELDRRERVERVAAATPRLMQSFTTGMGSI